MHLQMRSPTTKSRGPEKVLGDVELIIETTRAAQQQPLLVSSRVVVLLKSFNASSL